MISGEIIMILSRHDEILTSILRRHVRVYLDIGQDVASLDHVRSIFDVLHTFDVLVKMLLKDGVDICWLNE